MRSKVIVSKFGGTSMGDAKCMIRSAEIAIKQGSSIVVVSAVSGTTNRLIEMARAAFSGKKPQVEAAYKAILSNHQKISEELSVSKKSEKALKTLFLELEGVLSSTIVKRRTSLKSLDEIMSFGERFSSILFLEAMASRKHQQNQNKKIELIDARDIILTDSTFGAAVPGIKDIFKNCQNKISSCKTGKVIYVTQGFIGRDKNGATTTLGRGGSDYSAALFAEGLGADVLEIWTDVPGIATVDPRIVPHAKFIESISYAEAAELAAFGAKVLHPATIYPAVRQLIPIFVGSSFDPLKKGTWVRHTTESLPLVRGLALRKKQAVVTISSPYMVQAHGFLYKLFKIFDSFKISIDAITTSETTVTVTLDESAANNQELLKKLEILASVNVEEGNSLVALIGNKINETPGLVSKIFGLIPEVNVRMICQGSSSHNICFLVSDERGPEVIKKLHKEFFTS
jgi:aspartate kinase